MTRANELGFTGFRVKTDMKKICKSFALGKEQTAADRLALEAGNVLPPHVRRLKINITIMGFPPYTLPDEPACKHAYVFVSGETKDKDDWAVTEVGRILDAGGFNTEQCSHREIKILGRASE